MPNSQDLPEDLQKMIPKAVEKGIYYRLYRRKDGSARLVWWVKVFDKNSNPIYESSDSSRYEDAVQLKKRLIAQVETEQRSGGDPSSVRIGELLDDMLADGTKAKPETLYIYKLVIDGQLRPFFGKLKAAKLTTDHLRSYRKKRKSELVAKRLKLAFKTGQQVSDKDRERYAKSAGATVNRELARLRTALEHGMKQTPKKVLQIPHFPMESEQDNVRKVVLQDQDYPKLRDAFDDPGVQLLFVVSAHTGIRASELKRIKWSQVDFARKVIALERGKTKNKDPRSAPLYGDMGRYLGQEKQRRDEYYPDCPWVFSRAGEQIKDFRGEWDKAVRKAGVPDLHFHDLRRTAQRLMRRAGIDKITRMRIMGHKTDAMDIRYGVVEDEDIVEAGAKLEEAFQAAIGNRNGQRNGEGNGSAQAQPTASALEPEVLAQLATLDGGKLKALLALLGDSKQSS